MTTDQTDSVNERLRQIRDFLVREDVGALLHDYGDEEGTAWNKRLAELEKELQRPPETHIALIGSTGAGKSTLLNALLGAQILPVSSMKPCTAVITTVRFAASDSYQARISFLSQPEWAKELYASAELLDAESDIGEEERQDITDWNALKRVTQDKIRAVYGERISGGARLDLQNLQLPEELTAYMVADAEPLLLEDKEQQGFKSKLREYLSGESSFWPIVKSVEISGPFAELKHGTVLIDLPGVNDPNQAREEVTRAYLRDASYIWVVFNMKRGVTKDIRDLLVEQKMLRQFLLEGKVNTLTMVGTHADEFSDDATEELGLDENAEMVEIVRARNARVKEQVRKDLSDIADDLARLADAGGDSLQRLRQTLAETHIYTVSTRAYMKVRDIGTHRKEYGIEEASDTEVPQLLAHIETICRGQDHLVEVDQKASLLLSEIESFFRSRRTQIEGRHGELAEQLRSLRATLEHPREELEHELLNARQRAEEGFRAHQEIFEERLQIAVGNARMNVERVLDSWVGIHWSTLRAVVIRAGEFTSPSTAKRHDFNADIAEPLFQAIPFVWDDFFGHHFETSLAEIKGHLNGRSEVFLERLRSEARQAGAFDDTVLNNIVGDIEVTRQSLELQIRGALSGLRNTITRKRGDLASQITRIIGAQMSPAYEKARQEKGSGMKMRMLRVLREHAASSMRSMYELIEQDLLEGINELKLQFADNLKKLNDYVLQQADRVLSNLGGGRVAVQTQDTETLLQQLDDLLERISELSNIYLETGSRS